MNEEIRCYHCDTHVITVGFRHGDVSITARKIKCPVCGESDNYVVPKFPIITFNLLTGNY